MEEAINGVAPQSSAAGVPPIRWYSRGALDEFLAAADREQTRLESTIADAQQRLARANSAVGLHQTMIEMILEAQRDVTEIRRTAELRAGEIVAAGEREAAAILQAAPARTNGDRPTVPGSHRAGGGPAGVVVDLPGPAPAPRPNDDEAFFSYLRDELDKDEPLGPWQA